MKAFNFLVQGSSPQPYETIFYLQEKTFIATCTCAAGGNGQVCKHRLSILEGDVSNVININHSHVAELLQAIKGSTIDLKLQELRMEEAKLEELKRKVQASRKELARAMLGK